LSVYRGALLTDHGGASPALTLQYGPITFAGLAFVYALKFDILNVSLGANYFNDHMMNQGGDSFRNQRPESYEGWAQLNLPVLDRWKVSSAVYQDLRATWGQYLSVGTSYSFLKYFGVGATVGGGPISTNQYIYGPGAAAGAGHIDPAVTYGKQALPWKGFLSASVVRPYILQKANREAGFVDSDDRPLVVSVSGIWSL
jgi:hypothetical protein